MGRPSKFTEETIKKILDAIGAGNYYEAACVFAGIDYSTFRHWMVKGEQAKSGQFKQFFEDVKEAEAKAEVRAVAMWQKQMPNSWQASRDFLARRHPTRWMPKEGREHSGEQTNEVVIRYADRDNTPKST